MRAFGHRYQAKAYSDKFNFTIGLPIGEDAEKSLSRFTNHFMLSKRNDGSLDGALAKLKFVNIDENSIVRPTREGLDFLLISNPIIDAKNLATADGALSGEERNFYLNHIKHRMPGEFDAVQWLLVTIKNGRSSRSAMEKELKAKYKEWSYTVVTTQHMGLVSRCAELQLLKKERHGKEVRYVLTKHGTNVLKPKK